MNPLVVTWIYILVTISLLYWFLIGGMILFPNVHPTVISLIGMLVIYYLSNQKTLILLV